MHFYITVTFHAWSVSIQPKHTLPLLNLLLSWLKWSASWHLVFNCSALSCCLTNNKCRWYIQWKMILVPLQQLPCQLHANSSETPHLFYHGRLQTLVNKEMCRKQVWTCNIACTKLITKANLMASLSQANTIWKDFNGSKCHICKILLTKMSECHAIMLKSHYKVYISCTEKLSFF